MKYPASFRVRSYNNTATNLCLYGKHICVPYVKIPCGVHAEHLGFRSTGSVNVLGMTKRVKKGGAICIAIESGN